MAHSSIPKNGTALVTVKRGRTVTIAKLVRAIPLDEIVLAMPFRNRREVHVVSIPPAGLALARRYAPRFWVVRLDKQANCLAFPLAEVERYGYLGGSDGRPEWFVPLSIFEPITWQDWPFSTATISIDPVGDHHGPTQLELFSRVAS